MLYFFPSSGNMTEKKEMPACYQHEEFQTKQESHLAFRNQEEFSTVQW